VFKDYSARDLRIIICIVEHNTIHIGDVHFVTSSHEVPVLALAESPLWPTEQLFLDLGEPSHDLAQASLGIDPKQLQLMPLLTVDTQHYQLPDIAEKITNVLVRPSSKLN